MMTIIKMHNSDGTARHCLPILQTDNSGIWEKLETARLVLDDAFKQACNALGIQAYVGRGNKFERAVQVFFECWIPAVEDPFLTERVWAQVTVEAMPYHQFELEYTVNIFNRGRTKELGTFGALDASQVHALVSRLVQNAKLPELSNRVQKPVAGSHQASAGKKNKVTATRADIVGALLRFLLKALLIGGLAALAIGYFALSKDESAQVATMAAGGAAVVAAIILAVILNNMKVAIR